MEYDTKTRKSASFSGLQDVASAYSAYNTRQSTSLYASQLEERQLTFASSATCSPVAHGGQELVRILLRPGQMAHNHGMTPFMRLAS